MTGGAQTWLVGMMRALEAPSMATRTVPTVSLMATIVAEEVLWGGGRVVRDEGYGRGAK